MTDETLAMDSVSHKYVAELEAENAALRELVRRKNEILKQANNSYVNLLDAIQSALAPADVAERVKLEQAVTKAARRMGQAASNKRLEYDDWANLFSALRALDGEKK
ncbi:MAG: hypothetical protein C4523_02365 [Myxococcales bacterium]|nr:MAG: hypothetical protein C4523_02365 [Myxococcales bacterium]